MASTEDQFTSTDEGAPQPVVPAAGAEAPPAEGDAPAPRTRARRATKKASAPSAAPGSDAQDAPGDAGEAAAAPARKTAKKTARKAAKKAPATEAPAATDAPTDAATPDAVTEPPTATKATKAKKATKAAKATKATKAARSKATASEPAQAPDDPRLDEAGPQDALQAAVIDEEAILDEDAPVLAPVPEPDDEGGAGTAAPSFGLLFQAPDPAAVEPAPRRRRGRASAPVGEPPSTADRAADQPAAPQDAEPAADRTDRSDETRAGDTQAGDTQADDTQAHGPARSRRGRSRASRAERPDQADEADPAAPDQGAGIEAGATDEPDDNAEGGGEGRRRRRRGGKGRGRGRGGADPDESTDASDDDDTDEQARDAGPADEQASDDAEDEGGGSRRRRRRRRSGSSAEGDDPPGTVTRVRESRRDRDEPQSVKGSTRLEAKKQRRREGREAGRRRTIITEAEFLARRESVERVMVVREREGRTQIGVLEDDVLVEHYVSRETNVSMAGNVYLGRVQNVLPSMEAAFVDIGKGRNAVLYAGEVNWDAAGLENNQPKRIENALKSGDSVLVQVTKDPIGHKGARLTSQISLPGRYLVYVPEGSMTGISRKLPDTERSRLKGILKEVVPDSAGVIVRTAAEGASEEELRADVERLTRTWEKIKAKADSKGRAKGGAPVLVHGEPDLTVRVIRDVFNEDFTKLVVAGETAYAEVSDYLGDVAPDLAERLEKWTGTEDLFTRYRVDEQIAKAMDRKVWLPSGGSLVIDRTEAMTVVDVNTGKFVGSGGNLEETVTKNNIEAAEEIVRQLRLRDIGGIIVIDFIDMVLESNRDLVVRRLLECLGRDRTKHQVAEVTSLGLVQMTRKRVGSGLIEVFSENCEHCGGRGIIVHADPVEKSSSGGAESGGGNGGGGAGSARGRSRRGKGGTPQPEAPQPVHSGPTPAQIAAAAHAAALKSAHHDEGEPTEDDLAVDPAAPVATPEPEPELTPEPEAAPAPPVATPEPASEPTPQPVSQPDAAPRRRKRGRVVAPAGPPRAAAAGAAAPAPAQATGEQS